MISMSREASPWRRQKRGAPPDWVFVCASALSRPISSTKLATLAVRSGCHAMWPRSQTRLSMFIES
ncbi:hypothetical protein A9O66_28845 [Paraburkholderia caribensis]|uniref:Uncharacterized protein n=1 Tax=Paraburkholderia caribensis TaxID=75105 RepID=A0A9Q6WQ61_9BURK|nr:hypothetical protein A9O66_28845 [Paraburkholderia caribensis]